VEGLLQFEPGYETKIFGDREQRLALNSAGALVTQNYGTLDAATLVERRESVPEGETVGQRFGTVERNTDNTRTIRKFTGTVHNASD